MNDVYIYIYPIKQDTIVCANYKDEMICLFVFRFYSPVNPMGHVERGQFT